MGHWAKIFGMGIGAVFGGPVGAGIGAVVGAAVDGLVDGEDDEAVERPSSTRVASPRKARAPVQPSAKLETIDYGAAPSDGICGRLVIKGRIPAGTIVVWTVRRPDGRAVKSRAPQYADETGDLALFSLVTKKTASFFLPYGALKLGNRRECEIVANVLRPRSEEAPEEIAVFFWDLAVPARPWRPASQLASLIGLAMGMARADGRLDPAEVRAIKEFFTAQFDLAEHADDLRAVMKQFSAVMPPVEELLEDVELRHPGIDKRRILEFLVEVARADGTIEPAEIEYLRSIYAASGGLPEEFDDFLGTFEMVVEDLYAPLGLTAGVSLDEVRVAYRRLVLQYHPDKYAQAPMEFQELARVKTAELNEAYQLLCDRLAPGKGREHETASA